MPSIEGWKVDGTDTEIQMKKEVWENKNKLYFECVTFDTLAAPEKDIWIKEKGLEL
jgi:hypothetical protein